MLRPRNKFHSINKDSGAKKGRVGAAPKQTDGPVSRRGVARRVLLAEERKSAARKAKKDEKEKEKEGIQAGGSEGSKR
jgi:hypothetical protein